MSIPPTGFDGAALLRALFDVIESNLQKRSRARKPSEMNWGLQHLHSAAPWTQDHSPETSLERTIALLQPQNRKWIHQVPVASGLLNASADRRRSIDLVVDLGDHVYEFIELKVASDTPLFAAMEILRYGIVYLCSRRHADELGYNAERIELFNATSICLTVLAPRTFYCKGYNLAWLEHSLNAGLKSLPAVSGLDHVEFRFKSFPEKFVWRCLASASESAQGLTTHDELREALAGCVAGWVQSNSARESATH
jgi:hypothetical protein